MTPPLKAGVIGAGVFGGYHASKWAGFAETRLAAVFDVEMERSHALAERHGAQASRDADAFFAAVDVVSIASPAGTHARWALEALAAGKPVYVEKPLATRLDDADAIARAAARGGLVAACGFLERVALTASGVWEIAERPVRLEAVRRTAPSTRSLDVSVVLDLMIHDLDLALALSDGEPFAVEAEGARVFSDGCDQATAEVSFDDGLIASFEASRASDAPQRSLRLVYPSGEVVIDLAAGTLENRTRHDLDPAFGISGAASDRLGASLGAFLAAVQGREAAPLATAADGLRALDLALAVQQALGEG